MSDCLETSVGLTPLNDLGAGTYMTFEGGLYPGGVNTPPVAHVAEGLAAGQAVVRWDTAGNPSSSGSIAFLSIGMSNTSQEFTRFREIDDPIKAGYVFSVNGAQANRDAAAWANPAGDTWDTVESRLATFSLTPQQVGWCWVKLAVAAEAGAFPTHAQTFQGYLKDIVLEIASRYPNCQGVSFSSRVYGGYADVATSPEPWAYEGGFAVKWLIESQIDESDPDLAYGDVPWLGWGPYLWADGLTPRSDGLIWECDDFESDGTHPGADAEDKVANLLLDFMETEFNMGWFSGQEAIGHTALFSGTSTTDATSYDTSTGTWSPATGTWAPTAGELQIVSVLSRGAATPNQPTITGHGLTYVPITSVTFGTLATNLSRLTVFRAIGASPTMGGLVIDFAGQTQTHCTISVSEFSGIDDTGVNGAAAIGQFEENAVDSSGTIDVTLPDVATIAGSAVYAAFGNTTGTAYTPDTGWSEIHDIQSSSPLNRLETQYNLSFDQTANGALSSGATPNQGGIILELLPASDPGDPEEPQPPEDQIGTTGFIIVGSG